MSEVERVREREEGGGNVYLAAFQGASCNVLSSGDRRYNRDWSFPRYAVANPDKSVPAFRSESLHFIFLKEEGKVFLRKGLQHTYGINSNRPQSAVFLGGDNKNIFVYL